MDYHHHHKTDYCGAIVTKRNACHRILDLSQHTQGPHHDKKVVMDLNRWNFNWFLVCQHLDVAKKFIHFPRVKLWCPSISIVALA
jgi:hypothetical protein